MRDTFQHSLSHMRAFRKAQVSQGLAAYELQHGVVSNSGSIKDHLAKGHATAQRPRRTIGNLRERTQVQCLQATCTAPNGE